MFRDILASRLFLAGLAFFVLIVSGSLFYSWRIHRNSAAEMARTNQFLQQLKNKNEPRTIPDENVSTNSETFVETQTSKETNEAQAIVESTDALIDDTERLDMASAFLPADRVSTKEEPTEDVPVSPFGFGPYPKVPADYPHLMTPTWIKYNGQQSRDFELMDRNQGDHEVSGAFMENGFVYPLYPNQGDNLYGKYVILCIQTQPMYRKIEMPDGTFRRFISSASGPRGTKPVIPRGGWLPVLPEGVTALDMDNAGINPYEFLDLR